MTFKAVLFDCDGVLVNSESLYEKKLMGILSDLGFGYSHEDYEKKFVGLTDQACNNLLQEDAKKRGLAPIADDFMITNAQEMWTNHIEELTQVEGAHKLVTFAKQHFKIAVASNSGRDALIKKLNGKDYAPLFGDMVYAAQDVVHGKPAPDIYLKAAKAHGVDPKSCVVIEDSPTGIKAGVAAGMTAWGFLAGDHIKPWHKERLIEAGAHCVYDTAEDIIQALQEKI